MAIVGRSLQSRQRKRAACHRDRPCENPWTIVGRGRRRGRPAWGTVTTASNCQPAQKVLAAIITPMLLKTVQSRKIDLRRLITHRFKLDTIMDAYDTFDAAARTNALSCHRSAGVAAWRRGKRQFCAGK